MNFRTDLEILALEPQGGGLTLIDARAPDGTTVVLVVRVVEPLVVGGHMALALTATPTALPAPSSQVMRERVQARLGSPGAAAATTGSPPRIALNLSPPVAATTPAGATQGHAGASDSVMPKTPSAAGDASSLLLSSILGPSPRSSLQTERNVDDEMDALFGARRKG